MTLGPPSRIDVVGVRVLDLVADDVVDLLAQPANGYPRVAYAYHVGGLIQATDQEFVRVMNSADLVYADGVAVVALGRAAGATQIERAPTTDVGTPAVSLLSSRLGRPARVALVGGPPGLAAEAGHALATETGCEVVAVADGYFSDSEVVVSELKEAAPDLILVGMGMPKEAMWVAQHRSELPPAVVLTCGGWFGFLAGTEPRAPRFLQRLGLEWTYRLQHDFRRLVGRYAIGAWVTVQHFPAHWRRGRSLR